MTLLHHLREQAGQTQEQVAAALALSVSTVNRHEQGKKEMRLVERIAYGHHYGVTPDSIEQPERAAA